MPNLSIRAASTSHGHDPLDLVALLTLDDVSDVDDTAMGPGRSAVSIRASVHFRSPWNPWCSSADRCARRLRETAPVGKSS